MATTTPNLALLKKDPVADGADTFNIETMLNENWDKIDEAVGKKADVGEDGKIPAEQLPEMNYDQAGTAASAVSAHNTDPQAHPAMREVRDNGETFGTGGSRQCCQNQRERFPHQLHCGPSRESVHCRESHCSV